MKLSHPTERLAARVNEVIELVEKGNLPRGFQVAHQLFTEDPTVAEISNILGSICALSGNLAQSINYFKRAILANPLFNIAYFNFGTELNKVEYYREAVKLFAKSLTIRLDFAEAHNNLGLALAGLYETDKAIIAYRNAIKYRDSYIDAHFNLALSLFHKEEYNLAVRHFGYSDSIKSQGYLLQCFYHQNERSLFEKQLRKIIQQNFCNAKIGATCSNASVKFGIEITNPFCQHPLNFVLRTDLSHQHDFSNEFVLPVENILNDERVHYRKQALLSNGQQTLGNLFTSQRGALGNIEKIIRLEVEKYKEKFGKNPEGFMKNWPVSYELFGWCIRLQSGGKLYPHIHERGWLSGSIYIKVPGQLTENSGNLVVCLSDANVLAGDSSEAEKIITVETGTLCLFPSSLFHYTIPFVSDEDRIVLAFDVVPDQ